ncbi:MAG: hypothetical protein Q4G67_11920, partial [Actinomycetia bacterium]|nr:hypothetical protein [Actinomycetes bacterium]
MSEETSGAKGKAGSGPAVTGSAGSGSAASGDSVRRRRRAARTAAALGQLGVGVLLVTGVAWAGTQPAVTDRVDGIDLVRDRPAEVLPGSTVIPLERAALVCPGPELLGLAGARSQMLETTVTAIAAPEQALDSVPLSADEPLISLLRLNPDPDPRPDQEAAAAEVAEEE